MSSQMKRQVFANATDIGNLFEITIHTLIGYYRKNGAACFCYRMLFIILNNSRSLLEQRNFYNRIRLLAFGHQPILAINSFQNILWTKIRNINISESGITAEQKHIQYRL